MSKTHYFSLQPSETAIFQAAANIFASYIAAGQVTAENQAEMMEKAIAASISMAHHVDEVVIRIAASISMAHHVDEVVISDKEMSGGTGKPVLGKDVRRKS